MKLKPCPFCGCNAKVYSQQEEYKTKYGVCCTAEEGYCYVMPFTKSVFLTEEEAVEMWNRRMTRKDEVSE